MRSKLHYTGETVLQSLPIERLEEILQVLYPLFIQRIIVARPYIIPGTFPFWFRLCVHTIVGPTSLLGFSLFCEFCIGAFLVGFCEFRIL